MAADPPSTHSRHSHFCALSLEIPATYLLGDVLFDPNLSGAFNPDVLGYGVRLSSFVMNVCAGILIRWGSEKDADAAVQSTLVQIGSIVLCTMISLVRGQLTFFDGIFTLMVVHSPIAWYILWISARKIYRYAVRPADNILINAVLCFAIVCGWISLNFVVWFKGRKLPGNNCGSMSFKTYITSVVSQQLIPGEGTGWITPLVIFPLEFASFGVYILRYRSRYSAGKQPGVLLWKHFFLHIRFIFNRHIWLIYSLVMYSYVNWANLLVVWFPEPGYSFTYGQSLSVVAAVPSVLSALKLVFKLRRLTRADLCRIWRRIICEVVFFLHGSGKKAESVNKKYFHNRLPLIRSESSSLPFIQPPTPPRLAPSDATLDTEDSCSELVSHSESPTAAPRCSCLNCRVHHSQAQ